jgi:hypothetical protein
LPAPHSMAAAGHASADAVLHPASTEITASMSWLEWNHHKCGRSEHPTGRIAATRRPTL